MSNHEKLKVTVNVDDVQITDPTVDLDLDFDPIEDVEFFENILNKSKSKNLDERPIKDKDEDVTFRVTMSEKKTEERLFGRRQLSVDEWRPTKLDMTTDDVTKPETQERRMARARRFGIEQETKDFTVSNCDLYDLYESMDIDPSNEHIRLESLYLRGVNQLSTYDVRRIFANYHPERIEWINDTNCNVVWSDNIRAARTLLDLTKQLKRIKPMKTEAPEEGEVDNSSDEEEGQLKHRGGDGGDLVEVKGKNDVEINEKVTQKKHDCVEVDVNKVTVPPGKWRVLTEHVNKDTFLIVRFATVDDVKMKNAHRDSKYYAEYGNPNFGGLKGLISGTKRRMLSVPGTMTRHNGDLLSLSYKWTNRDKVRPGLNIFNDDGKELEWDYEHDTRFFEQTLEHEQQNTQNTLKIKAGKTAVKEQKKHKHNRKTIDDILHGRHTMRADLEQRKRHRPGMTLNPGNSLQTKWSTLSNPSENDDDEYLLDDDHDPSPTPQPWDRTLEVTKMKVTVPNRPSKWRSRSNDSDLSD